MRHIASPLYILPLLLVVCSTNLLGQEGWVDQTPPTFYPGILAVYAIDSENVWAVGEQGLILHTTDGGVNWDQVTSGTARSLYTVEFINADTGWVAGDDDAVEPTVLRTVNGGESWEPQSLDGTGALPIFDVDFIKSSSSESITGYITGGVGLTWKTENYGELWESIRNDWENTFWSSHFVSTDTGWFVGTPSVAEPYTIMHTYDGGESWHQQENPTERNLRGVSFVNNKKGVAVGLVGAMIYTSNGGIIWGASPDGGFTRWESVHMMESGKAWAVGEDGAIAHSTDFGHTWEAQESGLPAGIELWEVYFINDQEGWAVGGGIGQPGVILHTTNGGVSGGVNIENKPTLKAFNLAQNHPNPFTSTTRINYTIPEAVFVTMELYDAIGQLVQVLSSQHTPAGSHHIDISGSELAEGVYYYSIEAGKYRDIKKMMVLK